MFLRKEVLCKGPWEMHQEKTSRLLGCKTSASSCTSGTVSREVEAVGQHSLLLELFMHQHLCCRNAELTGSVSSPECGAKLVSSVAATSSSQEVECGPVMTA